MNEIPSREKILSKNALDALTVKLVLDFYQRDDISRQAPGKRDTIVVRLKNKKETVQKRHLYMNVNEAYAVFKSDYPEESVGKSKFASLRPPHVLLSSSMSRNVCCCKQHQNIILILEALHKFDSNFPLYSHEFPLSIVCDSEKDICYNNMCTKCKDAAKFHNLFALNEVDKNKCITWYQWEKVAEGNGKEYIKKIEKKGRVDDLYRTFSKSLPSFLWHYFIKQKQSKTYRDHKIQLQSNPDTAVLQVDFAENFSTLWQDEVQSAHWHKKQVTVFTAVFWYQNSCSSAVIVSDDLSHSKESILVFVHNLLSKYIESSVKILQVWTDRPSNQFKNRFIASAIPWLEEQHDLKLFWNFFAASHGKGPVDAIGGTVKRLATQKIIQRKFIITDAITFHEAVKNETNFNVYFVSMEDVINTI
ncbi:uncharacterized protein LOC136087088 [Hydra vulgaris]|uniref:Uncharacterized protein LOC136087088 n=1 Tax=Hydra vulgaris TaxID=6087 RepID=A0ABM4CUQ1_HYDVU